MQFEERLNNLHALNRTFNDFAEKNKALAEERQDHIQELQEQTRSLKEQLAHEKSENENITFKHTIASGTIQSKLNEIGVLKQLIEDLKSQMDQTRDENHDKRKEIASKDLTLKRKLAELADTSKIQIQASHHEAELRLKNTDL
jgi:chromosome segregation ATPase